MNFALSGEQQSLQERARVAAAEIVAPVAMLSDQESTFPAEAIAELGRRGFLGLLTPSEYGGEGVDHVGVSTVYEEFGRVDSSVRGFLAVHVGLVTQCVSEWGTPRQKERWLPLLAKGEAYGCYCLTEPEAGSDAASLQARASPTTGGWRLNGVKHWITNGNVAKLAIVFATVDPTLGRRGITAFLLPTRRDGFVRERMTGVELGHRGADHARITFDDVFVEGGEVLGNVGEGLKVAQSALDHGRLGVAAGAVGILQACLDASTSFSRSRRQFGKRIGDLEFIQGILADMAADTSAARWLTRHAAWLRDQGRANTHEVSLAKLFGTEAAVRAADSAVLLHGSRGYSNEYPVERYFRDAKGLQIYEGTSHIQRIIIARQLVGKDDGQGRVTA